MTIKITPDMSRLLVDIGDDGHLELASPEDPRMAAAEGLEALGFVRALPRNREGGCCIFVLSGAGIAQRDRELGVTP